MNVTQLPHGYTEILHLDLQKDKKPALLVNILAILIAVVMCVTAYFFIPLPSFFATSGGARISLLHSVVLLAGMILYMFLHELVHGICIKHFSGKSAHYGFTGLYAYAGSDVYFDKKSYLFIALAPIVFWGIVLLVLNCVIDISWFWVIYFIQVCNISGAAGDLYVTCQFAKLPSDILVQDSGIAMTVYSAEK